MIKMFVMDCDGTLTDGKINMFSDGEGFKSFDIKDGYGIKKMSEHGIITVILTGRNSKIVENRAKEIGIIELFQNVYSKLDIIHLLLEKYSLSFNEVAYIGDDLNDLECIISIPYSACPNDADEYLKSHVMYVSPKNGGAGAVRDFINFLIHKSQIGDIYD